MTLTNTVTAEYPEDLVKVAGDVCKAMGIASSVINAMPILNALVSERQRSQWQPTAEQIDEAARHLRETLQAGKTLKPWAITDKATKKKWVTLAGGTILAALGLPAAPVEGA